MITVSGLDCSNSIMSFLPYEIRTRMTKENFRGLEEIRLRNGLPVVLSYSGEKYFLGKDGNKCKSIIDALNCTTEDVERAGELIFRSSIYAHEDEIRQGFVTLPGGHRVGITGTVVTKLGQVAFIKDISALNYRIATDVTLTQTDIANRVYNFGMVYSTLIIAPPGAGKTTLLRMLVRFVSDKGVNVCVIDERHEIAAVHRGVSGFYLGAFTDVLDGCPKSEGMIMALRSMNPEIIATDEICEVDVPVIMNVINSGVKVFATVHASSVEELRNREQISKILPFFSCIITISDKSTHIPCEICIS